MGFLTPFFSLVKLILERIFRYLDSKSAKTYENDKQKMEDTIARGNAADITSMLMTCGGLQVKIISADREIKQLPNGHWEVTDLWLKDMYENLRYWKEQAEKK